MNAIILQCRPNSLFHFGKIALDENTSLDDTSTYLHSDTLFSAIINTASKISNKSAVDELVDAFKEDKIKISSGFYCLEIAQKYIYFLPKPYSYNTLANAENQKAIRKIKFISKRVWEEGILPKDWDIQCITIQNKFLLHKEELGLNISKAEMQKLNIYRINSLPKVKVHKRITTDALYYQTSLQLANNIIEQKNGQKVPVNVHFYFLADADANASYFTLFFDALRLLADGGIGGERMVGCGHFLGVDMDTLELKTETETETETEPKPTPASYYATLSLSNPKTTELPNYLCYDIVTRGGRPTIKDGVLKRVKMIAEGAITKEKVSGQIPSISVTQNPFLRNGKSFCIPIHSNLIPKSNEA